MAAPWWDGDKAFPAKKNPAKKHSQRDYLIPSPSSPNPSPNKVPRYIREQAALAFFDQLVDPHLHYPTLESLKKAYQAYRAASTDNGHLGCPSDMIFLLKQQKVLTVLPDHTIDYRFRKPNPPAPAG